MPLEPASNERTSADVWLVLLPTLLPDDDPGWLLWPGLGVI